MNNEGCHCQLVLLNVLQELNLSNELLCVNYLLGYKFQSKPHVPFALHFALSTDDDTNRFFLLFWPLLAASSNHHYKVWQKVAAAAEDV